MFTLPSVTDPATPPPELTQPPSGTKRKRTSCHNEDSSLKTLACKDNAASEKLKKLNDTTVAFPTDEKPKKSKKEVDLGEKRKRLFRKWAPQSYLTIKERALNQRLTVLSRERLGTEEVPEEQVVMAGSTGNVYTQHISHQPTCTCPHAKAGNQCKHLVYIMLRVLKAPEEIAYQLALTSSELRQVFQGAPPIPSAEAKEDVKADSQDGNRKPIEGECPICYTEFEPETEDVVYCKAGCGNNVHKSCMQSWMVARAGKATCPYCRAQWEAEDVGSVKGVDLKNAKTSEGYLNVASQLGLSGARDYSSYHQPWVRQQYGGGRRRRRGGGSGWY